MPAATFAFRRTRPLLLSAMVLLATGAGVVMGQMGVAPGRTGEFMDDLRHRHGSGESSRAAFAEERAAVEQGRELSLPNYLSASEAYALRSSADFSSHAGVYGETAPLLPIVPLPAAGGKEAAGPKPWSIGLYQGLEYNDNIYRTTGFKTDDTISRIFVDVEGAFKVADNATLTVAGAVGADYFFGDNFWAGYDDTGFVPQVLPGSAVALDVKAGPVTVTLYDRLTVQPTARSGVRGIAGFTYGALQNDAGLAATWAIDQAKSLTVNYTHTEVDVLIDQLNAFSRSANSVAASFSYHPQQTWDVGVESGATWNRFELFNSGGTQWHAGAFLNWRPRPATHVRVAGGYQRMTFESRPLNMFVSIVPPFGPTYLSSGDQTELSAPYFSLTVDDRISDRLYQHLTLGSEASLSNVSNFVEAQYATYGITAEAWKGGRVTLSAFAEAAQLSGGVYAFERTSMGGDLQVRQQLLSNLSVSFGGHFGHHEMDATGVAAATGKAHQFGWSAAVEYAFAENWTAHAAYRGFATDGQNFWMDGLDQNRLILGVRVQF